MCIRDSTYTILVIRNHLIYVVVGRKNDVILCCFLPVAPAAAAPGLPFLPAPPAFAAVLVLVRPFLLGLGVCTALLFEPMVVAPAFGLPPTPPLPLPLPPPLPPPPPPALPAPTTARLTSGLDGEAEVNNDFAAAAALESWRLTATAADEPPTVTDDEATVTDEGDIGLPPFP